ncbi:LTA synthase family protein [Lewinella sp. IMCC34183]|uniref:LTA synthase family protein n=1 Tax=Lewinella sp. IMCC34183 TaxID=2248762 RepID=UPI000E24B338|nr:LTA synthase family protein [Lewinella sp. IMCC34183]
MRTLTLLLLLVLAGGRPLLATDTLTQRIEYTGVDAGEVYLVLKPLSYTLEEVAATNPGARNYEGLVRQLMRREDDHYVSDVRLPEGAMVYYCFWITRNQAGSYLDYWDVATGRTITVADRGTISVAGTQRMELIFGQLAGYGWGLLFLLLAEALYLLAFATNRSSAALRSRSFRRIVGLGIGVALVHVIVRWPILNLPPEHWRSEPLMTLTTLLSSAAEDLTVIGLVVLLTAVLLVVLPPGPKRRGAATVGYVVLLMLTLSALINVQVVDFTGAPITYELLYYADFLLAKDARLAVTSKVDLFDLANAAGFLLGAVVLGLALERAVGGASLRGPALLLPLLLTGLLVSAAAATTASHHSVRPTRRTNAVWALLRSAVNADRTLAMSQVDLPGGAPPFREESLPIAPSERQYRPDDRVRNVLFVVLESAAGTYFEQFPGASGPGGPLKKYEEQSLVFDNFYAHIPSSNVAMVSLLSGVHPLLSFGSVTRERTSMDFPSLPSVLEKQGYRTSFFTSGDINWQRSLEYIRYRGFDTVEHFADLPCGIQYSLDLATYEEGNGVDDDCLGQRFLDWLDEDRKSPFFSTLWTIQGHYPYYFTGEEHPYGEEDLYFNRYLNAVRHGTEMVDRMIQGLRERGLDSSTLVVVTGDHGEAFGQHGHNGHANTLYEESVRVPMYLINPLLFSGERSSALGGNKDVAPTILSLLGQPVPHAWQGHNLLHERSQEAFYFSPYTQVYFGYRREDKKYLFNETAGTVEVYDLQNDPAEKHDLSAIVSSAAIDSARLRVAAWVQEQEAFYNAIK